MKPVIRLTWDYTPSYGQGWRVMALGRWVGSKAEHRLCYPDRSPRRLGEMMGWTK